jgi:S-adenosylmethionine synthetase
MYTIAAEDVLAGHPDRLCDAVAESLVHEACILDEQALVGVEVALHRGFMAVTGRIATGRTPHTELVDNLANHPGLVSNVFASAGYTGVWANPVDVVTDIDIDALADDEREIRRYSDDQGIAVGYADPAGPAMMPVEAIVARRLREGLNATRAAHDDLLGPDGKVIVTIEPGERPRLVGVNIAIQHVPGVGFIDLQRLVTPDIAAALDELAAHIEVPTSLDADILRLNGIGDFTCGGPRGDNGLSGKKLVVDHYGPQVPIGGGAICGKDVHKPDRVGPLRARQLAVRLANASGVAATVHLGWLPGLEEPDRLNAHLACGRVLDRQAIECCIDVPDLSLAGSARELELWRVDWVTTMLHGYLGDNNSWDR